MVSFTRLYIPVLLLFTVSCLKAQNRSSGYRQELSAGLQLPVSNFNETHLMGAGVQYAITNHRFGITAPKKHIGWVGSVGVDYYIGRKDKEAGHSFKNGNYLHSRLSGGIIVNPSVQTQVSLQAGPGWGIYQGTHAITLCSVLNGTYYINEQWGIAARLMMIKEKGAQILWTPGISLCRTL